MERGESEEDEPVLLCAEHEVCRKQGEVIGQIMDTDDVMRVREDQRTGEEDGDGCGGEDDDAEREEEEPERVVCL